MGTAFAPLLNPGKYDNPSFLNTPQELATATSQGQKKQQQPINPVIPDALNPQSIEEKLKAEGSGTSTISLLLALYGASRGNVSGLQAIEESKKRTALAKSMIPEITKVNEMVNTGKWKEASSYVNELVGSYGTRADYLVPYFQQMQGDIKKKEEGWNNLVTFTKMMEAGGASDPENINYRAYQALNAAVKEKTPLSETNLQGFMTRYGAPETQVINGRVTRISKLGGPTQTEMLPSIVSKTDMDNFAGITVASKHGLNTSQLADVMNGLAVKSDTGETIAPDSKTAQTIKTQFNALQPINADLEMAKVLPLEPAITLQAIKQSGKLNTARRVFGENIDSILDDQMNRITKQQVAVNTGNITSNPYQPSTSGMVIIGKDPSDTATYLKPQQPMPHAAIQGSKGKFGEYPIAVYEKQIVPAFSGIQALDTIPALMKINSLETLGDVLKSGVNQKFSSFLGYPVTKGVEVRQEVKARLQRAIEQAENIVINMGAASGHNDKDIADWKAYAAGNFTSTADLLKNVKTIRERLNQVLDRSGVSPIPESEGQSPARVLSNAITKGKGSQSQITRQPYTGDIINIPPEIDEDIKRRIADSIKNKETGGAARVEIPNAPSITRETPTLQQAPPSALDRAREGMQRRQMQRMK
jgi:hypothetical protein